jgi:hypothetical protein
VSGKRRLEGKKAAPVSASPTSGRSTRLRYGPLPEVTPEVEIPYANTRATAVGPGRAVRAILDSNAWQTVMKPELDRREQERQARRKVKPAYSCEELESVFLFQYVCGLDTVRQTRAQLTSHLGAETRRLLGFDRPRQTAGQVTPLHSVPSEATLCRYRLSFAPARAGRLRSAQEADPGKAPTAFDFKRAEEQRQRAASRERAELYERLLKQFVADYAKTPEGAEAAQLLFMDGTTVSTFFTPLITRVIEYEDANGKKTKTREAQNDEARPRERCTVQPVFDEKGRPVWDGVLSEAKWDELHAQQEHRHHSRKLYWKVTAEDAGYVALGAGEVRAGPGYNIVSLIDSVGLPIGFSAGSNQPGERVLAKRLLDDVGPRVGAFPDEGVRVLSADAGFTGPEIRDRIRNLGVLDNIHPVSGSREAKTLEHEVRLTETVRRIVHKDSQRETWLADGHRNIYCECGQGQIQKRFHKTKQGRLIPRVEGDCPNCGPITVTSGDWKDVPGKWKHRSKNPGEADLTLGNPLTFTNPISKVYAKRRFAVQEGAHSILSNRFGLIRPSRRVKNLHELRVRTAMTYCVLHGIAQAQRARAAQPPGRALAA